MPTDPTPTPPQPYPGGEDAPGYKIAFRAWMVLFLCTICVGLLNFLAVKLR